MIDLGVTRAMLHFVPIRSNEFQENTLPDEKNSIPQLQWNPVETLTGVWIYDMSI